MTQIPSSHSELPEAEAAAAKPWRTVSRRTLTIALSVLPVVALINVGVLIWSLGGIDLKERIVAPHLLGLVAVLIFVPMIAASIRLALWSRFMGLNLGFLSSLKVITGTMVANSVTPSATGSAPIKMLFLMGEGVDSRRALTLISFQTAEDSLTLFSMLGLCLTVTGFAMFDFVSSDPELLARLDTTLRTVSMIALWTLIGLAALAVVIAGGLLGRRARLWTASVSRKIRSYLAQIAGDWKAAFAHGKWIACVNLVLALLQWIVRFSIAGLVLAAFGTEWQPALFWLLQYLVQSLSSIVPTPGGVGAAEAAFVLLFAPFVEMDALIPAMSTWRLMFFYLPLVGAALLFFVLQRRGKRVRSGTDTAGREAQNGEGGHIPHPAE